MSVFVSGGSDPLGRLVIRRLVAAGHRVTAMTSTSEGARLVREAGGLPVYSDPTRAGEIEAMLKMAKVDAVLHLAPQAANEIPFVPVDYAADQLTAGSAALAEAARSVGIQRAVIVSYAAVYAAAHDAGVQLLDETAHLEETEDRLITAALRAEQVFTTRLPAVVLRAGYIYGPECASLKETDQRLKVRTPVAIGEEHAYAAWIHSSDLVEAIVLALQVATSEPLIVNIVDDQPASPHAFARYLATSQGLNAPGRAPGMVERMLNEPQVLTNLSRSFKVSNQRAREVLGWQPTFKTFERGLDDVLLTWRAAMTSTS